MTLEQFFDKYPEAWIAIYRHEGVWYATLRDGESDAQVTEPVIVATATNQQVALGNLASKLLRWNGPQPQEPPAQ